MPSTNTTNLNLEKPAEGEQAGSWGDTINANMDLIDAAVAIKDEDDMSSNSASHLSTQQSIKAYVDANAGANPEADNIVAGDSAINLTTTAGNITIDAQEDNSDIILKGTDGGADTTFLTIDGSDAGTASFNHDIKLASDSAKIDFGADGDITLQHIADNGLILKNNNTGDGSDVRLLMRTGEQAIEANDVIGIIQFQAPDDTDGDPDGHTICGSVAAVAEGNFTGSSNATKLVFKLGVSEVASEKMSLSSGGDLSVSNDVKLASDSAVLGFGDDNDVTLTHVADTGLLLNGTMQLQFNDASQNITAPSATVLDINATDEVEINATLADINANLDVSGTYTGGGTMTTGGNIVIPNAGNIGSVDDTDAIAISSSGLVTISQDVTVGDDINMTSDSAKIVFGVDGDVTLQHTADNGLILKNNNTADSSDVRLLMRTGETAIEANDVVGIIQFQAPDDSDGDPDGHTVCASVSAVAEGNFTASSNATKLSFKTGASEAATEKMSLSSGGNLTVSGNVIIPDAGNIGSASDTDALAISSGGVVTATQMPITPNPGFKAYRNANQTITHATWTKVALDTEVYDVGGYFDHSTNYRFTPLVPGYYQINASYQDLTNDDIYDMMIAVYFNGTIGGGMFGRLRIKNVDTARDFYASTVQTSDILYMDGVDDYIELYAYIVGDGAGPILYGGLYRTTMSAMLISRTG